MESLAPPVVVVLVTHDPGPWFETVLQSLKAQDYPETSVLVVDTASSEDPTRRVADVLPEAFVFQSGANDGFGAAANLAISMVEGADFLVFCHDDVAPDPGALRIMVEEAFRSNAGVVGPKFVEWDHPERILHVGVEVDKTGAVVNRVERGEVDHGQHDAVRDVFSTSGGFTLVRRDLFAELGGFDTHISVMGEDLDFSWRAQVAGARVIVAPDARVRHLELLASGLRSPDCVADQSDSNEESGAVAESDLVAQSGSPAGRRVSVQELERRAELHAALKAYGPAHRLRVFPQMALLALAEMLVLFAAGRTNQAREVAAAWRWNFSLRKELRSERRELQALRRVSDSAVRHQQVRGSARTNRYMRRVFALGLSAGSLESEGPDSATFEDIPEPRNLGAHEARRLTPRPATAGRIAEERLSIFRRDPSRLAAWLAIFLFLAFGCRELLTGGLPVVGQFLGLPTSGSLLGQFVNGHHQFGSATASAATPATLLLGIAGYLLFGSTGLLQTLLVVGCLPVGAIGAARLCRGFGRPWAPFVAGACYLAVPLPYGDIATGRLDALFAYAAVPWLTLGLARASQLVPFAAPGRVQGVSAASAHIGSEPEQATSWWRVRPNLREPVRIALLVGAGVAALAAFAPSAALVIVVIGIGMSIGILVTGGQGALRAARRVATTTIASVVVAIVLLAPWSISVLAGSSPLDLIGYGPSAPGKGLGWAQLLRLAPGPVGGSPLVWGLLGAAALPLFIGRSWRLSWSGRMWTCAVVAWFVALISERGWFGNASLLPAVVLPVAACGLACSIALGVSAFRLDLPASRFGWRQVASAAAALAAVVGALPVVAASASGRFDLPSTGFSQALSWMQSSPAATRSGVVWLGDKSVVPGRPWSLAPGISYSTSSVGLPDLTSMWEGPPSHADARVARDIELASAGRTVELGHLLAANSIRYVVVVGALAPDVPGLQQAAPTYVPQNLIPALDAQTDLLKLSTEGGYEVYVVPKNVTPIAAGAVRSPTANALAIAGELVIWLLVGVVLATWRRNRAGRASRRSTRRRQQTSRIVPMAGIDTAHQHAPTGSTDALAATSGAVHG